MKIYIDGKETSPDDPTLQEAERMNIEEGMRYIAKGFGGVTYEAVTRNYGLSNRKIELVR